MPDYRDPPFEGNPYRSPTYGGDPFGAGGGEPGQAVTPKVMAMLRQTQPWVRFLSILGFIGCALMVLLGLFGFAVMALAPRGGGPGALLLLIYVPMGALYFFPSLFLFRYASRISALWTTRNVRDLEDALEAQKSFWRFVGILMLVVIILYLLMIALFVVLAVAGAVR